MEINPAGSLASFLTVFVITDETMILHRDIQMLTQTPALLAAPLQTAGISWECSKALDPAFGYGDPASEDLVLS